MRHNVHYYYYILYNKLCTLIFTNSHLYIEQNEQNGKLLLKATNANACKMLQNQ